MRKSLLFPILLLASLSVLALGFQAIPQGNYFYVPRDNHLSHEIYQTRAGAIAHSIEPTKENTFTSTYALIDIDAKDAISILSDLVRACDLPNPTFQSLHYHVQTDNLVYYCAKNSSLLILNQQDQTVKESIALPANVSLPVAKLSTDGDKVVAILLLDTLFNQSPQNSVLLKVDLQSKKLTTQVLFNQNLTNGEAVVAYTAGKNQSYIATNRVQGDNFALVVYSIVLTGNSYQLAQITTFNSSIDPKIITKLATLGDYVIVNKGTHIHFFDQQGFVQETEVKIKSLTSQANGISVPAFTAQYDGTLYALKSQRYIRVYSIVNSTLQAQNIVIEAVDDFQVAFGNPATPGSDLVFAPDDESKRFFEIVETKTFQVIYEVAPRYTDIVLSDTTYAVVRPLFNLNDDPEIHIFDLKTNKLKKIVYMYRNHTSNKDQKIISYLGPAVIDTCYLVHTDVASLKEWATLDFKKTDPICSGTVVNLRITENGNPEGVFKSANQYDIISETYGRITFPRTSDTDSINVNFDGKDLALYYYSANQTTNQITASLYGYNPITKNFTRISTNTLDNRAVEDQGFFTSNQSTTFALSEKSFTVLNKLKSDWSQENFPNVYNGLSTFTDDTNTQFTFFAYDNSLLATGLPPILFSSHSLGFVAIAGERLTTVNGIATGPDSYALHDDLKPIGVVRFFKTYPVTTGTKTISI